MGFHSARYEDKFEQRLIAAIRPGDCVWDVGANVGYYTLKFEAAARPDGRVVAFEPSPANRTRLSEVMSDHPAVVVRSEALGASTSNMCLVQGEDDLGATSRVVAGSGAPDEITVTVARGDALQASARLLVPNIIKIDTEGFELDVLTGLEHLLPNPMLRTIGIEVHFGILAERGLAGAPAEIERRLREAGFRTRWTDASHIIGERAWAVA